MQNKREAKATAKALETLNSNKVLKTKEAAKVTAKGGYAQGASISQKAVKSQPTVKGKAAPLVDDKKSKGK